MHPVEHLRAIARSATDDPTDLAASAALALGELARIDPAALVAAARRLVERQPACGAIWWVAARVLAAADPESECEAAAEELWADPTFGYVEAASLEVPGGVSSSWDPAEIATAGAVGVEVLAIGAAAMALDPRSSRSLIAASDLGVQVWLVAPRGRMLPSRIWSALERMVPGARRQATIEEVPRYVERIFTPSGSMELAELASACASSCPEPSELLAPWISRKT